MLLTISEVRGWQNQEKTVGAMCYAPARVREKTVTIPILKERLMKFMKHYIVWMKSRRYSVN